MVLSRMPNTVRTKSTQRLVTSLYAIFAQRPNLKEANCLRHSGFGRIEGSPGPVGELVERSPLPDGTVVQTKKEPSWFWREKDDTDSSASIFFFSATSGWERFAAGRAIFFSPPRASLHIPESSQGLCHARVRVVGRGHAGAREPTPGRGLPAARVCWQATAGGADRRV